MQTTHQLTPDADSTFKNTDCPITYAAFNNWAELCTHSTTRVDVALLTYLQHANIHDSLCVVPKSHMCGAHTVTDRATELNTSIHKAAVLYIMTLCNSFSCDTCRDPVYVNSNCAAPNTIAALRAITTVVCVHAQLSTVSLDDLEIPLNFVLRLFNYKFFDSKETLTTILEPILVTASTTKCDTITPDWIIGGIPHDCSLANCNALQVDAYTPIGSEQQLLSCGKLFATREDFALYVYSNQPTGYHC